MSHQIIEGNNQHREQLVPVVAKIIGTYVAILTLAYFVGNMIYQIP